MSDLPIHDIYRLLINRVDCYLTWYDRWVLRRAQLNAAMIEQALRGEFHLGVQAISGTGTARWTCLDADDDTQFGPLAKLAASLPMESRLLERSRRGGHLWLFHTPIIWDVAHQRGVELASSVGLPKIEVYPKYAGVHAVRLMGTKHPKTGVTYPIIEPTTGEILSLAQALAGIAPAAIARSDSLRRVTPIDQSKCASNDVAGFDQLVALLTSLTSLKVYAPNKASGRCPWHADATPSLYVKGRRFHCLACGVWGDAADVRRFVNMGIRPPS